MKKQIALITLAIAAAFGITTSAMADTNVGGNHHNIDNSVVDNSVNFTTTIVDIDIDNSVTMTAVDMGNIDLSDLDGVLVVQGLGNVSQTATSFAKGIDATADSINVGNIATVHNAKLDVAVLQGAVNVDQFAVAGAVNCGNGCGSGSLSADATNAVNVATLTSIASNTSVAGIQGSLNVNQSAHAFSVAAATSAASATNVANSFSVKFD